MNVGGGSQQKRESKALHKSSSSRRAKEINEQIKQNLQMYSQIAKSCPIINLEGSRLNAYTQRESLIQDHVEELAKRAKQLAAS